VSEPAPLLLLSRRGCHLCHRLEALIRPRLPRGRSLETRDIAADPELRRRWGERIPVLLDGEAVLLEGRPDPEAVDAALARAARYDAPETS